MTKWEYLTGLVSYRMLGALEGCDRMVGLSLIEYLGSIGWEAVSAPLEYEAAAVPLGNIFFKRPLEE